jgi:hypothetical protein
MSPRNDALDGASFTGEFKMAFTKLDKLPPWQAAVFEKGLPVNKGTALIWSSFRNSEMEPPAIGDFIRVRINGLGRAQVTGYFSDGGFLGVTVRYSTPPAWYVKQNRGNVEGGVFGSEISPDDV